MFALLIKGSLGLFRLLGWMHWAGLVFGLLLMPAIAPMAERESRAAAVRAGFESAHIPVVFQRHSEGLRATPTRELDAREELLWRHVCAVENTRRVPIDPRELRIRTRRARSLADGVRTTLRVTPGEYSTAEKPFRVPDGWSIPFFAIGAALLLLSVRPRKQPDGTTLASRLANVLSKGAATAAVFAAGFAVGPDHRAALLPDLYRDLQPVDGRIESADAVIDHDLELVTVAYDFNGLVRRSIVSPVIGSRRPGDRVVLSVNRFGARLADVDYDEFEPRPLGVMLGTLAVTLFAASRLVLAAARSAARRQVVAPSVGDGDAEGSPPPWRRSPGR